MTYVGWYKLGVSLSCGDPFGDAQGAVHDAQDRLFNQFVVQHDQPAIHESWVPAGTLCLQAR